MSPEPTPYARHGRRAPAGDPARHGHRVFTVLSGLVSALLLVLAGVGYAAYAHLDGNITSQDISGLLGHRAPKVAKAGAKYTAQNILLLGSDTRAGANAVYGKDPSLAGTGRSDTAIVLHLSADRKRVIAMSIPRDSMVQLPDCPRTDPTGNPTGGTAHWSAPQMFNSAYATGGAACTVAAVESTTGISIDHYVVIDFSGFAQMVDALGGIEVCVPKPIHDRDSLLTLPVGRSVLQGQQALGFVRLRHVGDGSDLSRIKRQQTFLSSVANKAMDAKLLARPDRLYAFLDAATKSVTADPGLGSLQKMQDLAASLGDIKLSGVQFVTVPTHAYPTNHDRVEWDAEGSQALFDALRYDRPLPGTGASSPKPTPPVVPTQVTVDVYNATGETGKATKVAAALRAQGLTVGRVGNWSRRGASTSIVAGPDVATGEVTTLSMFLPGVPHSVDSGRGNRLALVLGSDFTSVHPLVHFPTPTAALTAHSAQENVDHLCG